MGDDIPDADPVTSPPSPHTAGPPTPPTQMVTTPTLVGGGGMGPSSTSTPLPSVLAWYQRQNSMIMAELQSCERQAMNTLQQPLPLPLPPLHQQLLQVTISFSKMQKTNVISFL
jgi:hypothetical protein